jgi:hypothetical protein
MFAPRRQLGDALEALVEALAPGDDGGASLYTAMGEMVAAWRNDPNRSADTAASELEDARIRLEISFSRPRPKAEIAFLIEPTKPFRKIRDQNIVRAIFRPGGWMPYKDRRDRVTITEQTIVAVAETLRTG